MRKILFFIPSLFNSGGTERISTTLANELHKLGYSIDFVVHSSSTKSFFFLDSEIAVHSLNLNGNINTHRLKAALRLHKLIKKYQYDMIINVGVACAYVSVFCFPQLLGCKVLSWEHFVCRGLSFYRRLKHYVSVCLSNKTVVLTSADMYGYPKILRRKIVVIPNFTCINIENKVCSLETKTVLSAGRIDNIKGFDLLIEAWKKISKIYPDWKLRIAGGGNADSLKELINKYGLNETVSLIGPVSDMAAEYMRCSLFVLSSRFESFGLVIIEAKSFGVPVVSFDCPLGPREIIRNGKDGLLVENGNISKLAEAISTLVKNKELREVMGACAVDDYQYRWNMDKVVSQWVSLLNELN